MPITPSAPPSLIEVRVAIGRRYVGIELCDGFKVSSPKGTMSPDEARRLARNLVIAADAIDHRGKEND